jgi:hypothetical protein
MKELTTTSSSGTGLASRPSTPANGLIGPLPNGGDKFLDKPLPKNVDSIRLIILKPRVKQIEEKDHSVVRCELSHVTFAQKPQYEALSYTWGDPNDLKDVFCTTTNGYMGWVPSAAQTGDAFCFFEDFKLPFVLRSCEEGYKLVGDAYLHGLMYSLFVVMYNCWYIRKQEVITG